MSQEEDRVRKVLKYLLEDKDAHFTANWVIIDQIISIKGLLIKDDDQVLPEIPEFQYDEEEYRPYLRRGAINYSKMLRDDWVKVIGGK